MAYTGPFIHGSVTADGHNTAPTASVVKTAFFVLRLHRRARQCSIVAAFMLPIESRMKLTRDAVSPRRCCVQRFAQGPV